MKVSELMTRDVKTCAPDATASDAARIMWDHDCGSVPIVERGRLRGIVTDRDLLMAAHTQGKSPHEVRLSSLTSARVETCKETDDVQDALAKMAQRQIRRLPVVDRESKLVGILSLNDVSLHTAAGTPGALAVAQTLAAVGRHREPAPATTR